VDKLTKQVRNYTALMVVLANLVSMLVYVVLLDVVESFIVAISLSLAAGATIALLIGWMVANYALRPLQYLSQAITHVSTADSGPAPDMTELGAGQQLITQLALQVYHFASQTNSKDLVQHRNSVIQASNIVSHMPLPLFVFNKDQVVTHASDAGVEYCGIETSGLFGKKLFEVLNLEFPSENTLENWVADCQKNKVTDNIQWERVRVLLPGEKAELKQCDIAAYYNRDNPSGTEFIITMFDRTAQYDEDERSLGFVALAVHELRTPLTVLRGYVEVFQDELGPTLSPELQDFMRKMEVSTTQLAGFVKNILNVARLEENKFDLQLTEQNWEKVLSEAVETMSLRAQVHKKILICTVQPNLPTVAVDQVSIQEVVYNLIDNAIKYSGPEEKQIIINTHLDNQGNIETTVQDFGVGMPNNVVQNLFEKFYRNHRTQSQFGGSGLGLYLSKAIVNAHGGQIGVSSKVDQGSTFSFTIIPYANMTEELKTNSAEITRSAHGWIKNHSIYRR
jgi:signal transduction histidine kinase